MALPIIPKPAFPNVPNVPGVPSVLRQVGNIQNTVVSLVSDAAKIINLFSGPQWGLLTPSGAAAFASASSGIIAAVLSAAQTGNLSNGQSIGGVEYRQDHRISTAPQEQGAFLSYNKVSTPYAARVTYIIGGTQSQRTAFLNAVKSLQASTTLLNLVTPEITYSSCNIVHHDYRRVAYHGVSMLAVDIWVEEVRIAGPAAYSSTKTPSGANPVNGGSVQPQALTPAQQLAAGTAPL